MVSIALLVEHRRGDPLWKLLGAAALCLHWFNPLVWLSFGLACQDMERSCDEAVLRQSPSDIRAAYAETLLRCSAGAEGTFDVPPAFHGLSETIGDCRGGRYFGMPDADGLPGL